MASPRTQAHRGDRDLAVAVVGEGDDGGLEHRRVLLEGLLDLDGVDGVAAALDDVLHAALEVDHADRRRGGRGRRCAASRRR